MDKQKKYKKIQKQNKTNCYEILLQLQQFIDNFYERQYKEHNTDISAYNGVHFKYTFTEIHTPVHILVEYAQHLITYIYVLIGGYIPVYHCK